ncbi:ABC transporter substrate-binding protein [Pseudonocardia sp. HH130630-07]|uniref:ABC transporter substrate-binding protein n=1 Tax=Pseudonocardia sp. HH130630-07 TaxID=1690815 RepID=UPI0008150531|nr:ABC transporter substrate-binding protein [Pseudonocardia sp. HH130630-07]ANY08536.1 aliphatic sulfonate ABC transporter substrate-binding protein [Pseudonocardia sp. HH130630-07]
MTRRLLAPALLTTLALVLAGCSGGAGADDGPVTLRVGDQAGIQQALVEASGALDGSPYRVEWSQFPAAAPLLEALRGEAIDLGIAGDAPTLTALSSTDRIRIVEATRSPSQGGLALLVGKDSPIRSVADLRGRTVSPTTQGSIGHYLLLRALEEAGVRPDEVTISFLQPVDAAAAMNSGAIDAWSTWDPYTAVAQQESGARVLRDAKGLGTGLTFLDANTAALDDPDTRAALADFTERYGRALQWARDNPQENARIYGELTDRPAAVADLMAERALRASEPLTPELTAELQGVADRYADYGVLRERVDVGAVIEDVGAPVGP